MPALVIALSVVSLLTGFGALIGASIGASAIKDRLESDGPGSDFVIDLLSWVEKHLPARISGIH